MRFSIATIALYAALVYGQNQNAINIPQGESTLDITAGQSTTITWQNPSSGTVTLQLQYAGTNQLAGSGITLASDVPASAESATFVIPASAVSADGEYTIRITDDDNPSNVNFAPAFTVAGASGTASLPAGTSTSGSATSTGSTSGTSTGTSSSTDSSSTATSTDSSSTESASSTSSSSSSRTSSSTSAAETTSAPSAAAGAFLKVQGGALAAAAAAVAFL